MDTSHPSQQKGKRPGARDKSDALRREVHHISLSARDDAKPFGTSRGGETVLNARGKALAGCWRELALIRPALEPDALVIGPRRIQGLLLFKSKAQQPVTLAEAVKLFKVLSSLRLAQLAKNAKAEAERPASAASNASNASVAPGPAKRAPAPSALWKKGYSEKTISGSAELAEARKALKGLQAR